jgi:Tfp pilus assembly protein PilP
MMTALRFIVIGAVLAMPAMAMAQPPAPKAPAAKAPEPKAPAVPPKSPAPARPATNATPLVPVKPVIPLPVPPANYLYSSEGRRDPFSSLINRGTDAKGQGAKGVARGEGLAGITTSELAVKGILLSRGTWLAMVTGADNKVYTVRAGDRLADGVVRAVRAQAVVILQEVNDPLTLEKVREVRKFLRGGEEVK